MEKVERFISVSSGSGWGSGDGSDWDSGWGWGSGDGSGYGYNSGWGWGSGDGSGVETFCGDKVHNVDGIPTIINHVFGNAAKGWILNSDLTLTPTWVVKANNLFAHGNTLREAQAALEEKLFENMPVEDRISEFIKRFDFDKKYPATEFFEWHNRLTGSCLQGREHFVKSNNIDLSAEFTVEEFIKICENAYGGEIIKQLRKEYQKS